MPKIASKLQRFVWPILIVIATVLLIVLMNTTQEKPHREPARESRALVDFIEVKPDRRSLKVRLFGRVETPYRAGLTVPVTGYVQSINVFEGDKVEAGQPLIVLDPRDQQLVVAQREADLIEASARLSSEKISTGSNQKSLKQEIALLDLARMEYKRQKSLKEQNLISQSSVDNAQASLARQQLTVIQRQQQVDDQDNKLQQMKAQVARAKSLQELAQLDLERSQLKAPFAGRVSALHVAPGERVQAGEPVVELYPEQHLEIRAQIPDRLLPQVRELLAQNQPVTAQLSGDSSPNTWHLKRLAADVDKGRGGVDALFRTASDNKTAVADQVILGRPIVITLSLPLTADVVTVPPKAVYDDSYVYRVTKEQTLAAVPISILGVSVDNGRECILVDATPFAVGDRIMTTRMTNAVTGQKVAINQSKIRMRGQYSEGSKQQ